MKKLLLIPALLVAQMAFAQDYKYEITPLIGYNVVEGNLDLKNQFLSGAEIQFNDCNSIFKPELSILYTDADYENSSLSTDIYRIAINGVREYDAVGGLIPLTKAGVGYETIDKHFADNSDSVFFDAGVGAKIPFNDSVALKLEAVYMLKNSGNRWDNNLALLAGLNFAFGPKAQPSAPKVDGDDDNDGVLNSMDKCPNTPAGTKVDSNGCKVDGDDDNDGVLNSMDRCPNTPAGTKVDSMGCKIAEPAKIMKVETKKEAFCPPKINLHINFEFDSAKIKEDSLEKVTKFSEFLKCDPGYDAKIIGHTDSKGSEAYNMGLSQRRADAVKDQIIKDGVDPQRITTSAKGESEPIATNKTKEGRAQNRRIEAELIKK